LPTGTPPLPYRNPASDDWTPYENRKAFETAEFLYCKAQMSAPDIDTLMSIWSQSQGEKEGLSPFKNHTDLYDTIDKTPLGDVPWQSFTLKYEGEELQGCQNALPQWKTDTYKVFFRDPHTVIQNMLASPDFKDSFDYTPYHSFDDKGYRRYEHLFSGDWAWKQAVSSFL
jgi:hypothetical protein